MKFVPRLALFTFLARHASATCLLTASTLVAGEVSFSNPGIVWNEASASAVRAHGAVLLAMNVGGAEPVIINSIAFEPGSPGADGADLVLEGDGATVTVRSNHPDGGINPRFSNDLFYSNNFDFQTLMNSGIITGTEDGRIEIEIAGLTPGATYQLDTFHFQPGVEPKVRRMIARDADSPEAASLAFTYHDPNEGPKGTPRNAVRVSAIWTANAPEKNLVIEAAPGFNRATLNGLVLSKN